MATTSALTRTRPPFRADEVGSLLRPAALHDARRKHESGELDHAGLRAVEDQAIRDAVALQKEAGLQVATDGEFRRAFWNNDFMWALGGVEREDHNPVNVHFRNSEGDVSFAAPGARVVAPITLPETIFAEHFTFLKSIVGPDVTPKITIPSPSQLFRAGRKLVPESVYPNIDDFWNDVAEAYRAQVKGLYELGCRYLQIDDTAIVLLCDPERRNEIVRDGDDPDDMARRFVKTINSIIGDRPDDLAVTIHTCRGNHASAWQASGGYEPIAEVLLGDCKVDGFFMEWETDRAGNFKPLRHLPPGKQVVLGLISSKVAALESKDDIKRRIEEAAQYCPLEQLSISPQCGFASTEQGNNLTVDDERAKLSLAVEVAHEVWG